MRSAHMCRRRSRAERSISWSETGSDVIISAVGTPFLVDTQVLRSLVHRRKAVGRRDGVFVSRARLMAVRAWISLAAT